jgi:hypothetical protein
LSLDVLQLLVGSGMEIALIALFLYKRAYKTFPIFCIYIFWDLLDNLGLFTVARIYPKDYFQAYLAALAIDAVFMFAVLVELAWSVLRPFRSSLPRGAIVGVALVVGAIGAAVWPFAHSATYALYGPESRLLLHLQQTVAIMRILFFLVLAACSQLLSINWRDREMQIATGLGFYSLISVAVSILHAGQTVGSAYYLLDKISVASYLGCLGYLIYSFAHEVVPRREFTPQMQGILLAVAGAARSTRVAMTGPDTNRLRERDK